MKMIAMLVMLGACDAGVITLSDPSTADPTADPTTDPVRETTDRSFFVEVVGGDVVDRCEGVYVEPIDGAVDGEGTCRLPRVGLDVTVQLIGGLFGGDGPRGGEGRFMIGQRIEGNLFWELDGAGGVSFFDERDRVVGRIER